MNVEKLEELRQFMLNLPPEKIDMSNWSMHKDCGTVACIGGWLWELYATEEEKKAMTYETDGRDEAAEFGLNPVVQTIKTHNIVDLGKRVLGLDYDTVIALFGVEYDIGDLSKLSKAQAINAITVCIASNGDPLRIDKHWERAINGVV